MTIDVKGIDDVKVLENRDIKGIFFKDIWFNATKVEIKEFLGSVFILVYNNDLVIGNILIDQIKTIDINGKMIYIKTS